MTYFDQQHLNGPDAFIMLLVIYCRKLCSLLSPSFSPIIILFIFIKVFQLSLSQSIINIKSFCQCLQLTLCFGIFVIITPGNIKLADNINSDNCNNMVEASCVAGCSGKFGEEAWEVINHDIIGACIVTCYAQDLCKKVSIVILYKVSIC